MSRFQCFIFFEKVNKGNGKKKVKKGKNGKCQLIKMAKSRYILIYIF